MKRLNILSFVVALAIVGLISPFTSGQEHQVGLDKWAFDFTPYLWLSELDADAQLGGLSGSAEMDFKDLLDFVEFAASGRFEAWKQDWGFFFDGLYLDLEADFRDVVGPIAISVDSDVRLATLDLGVAHRLVDVSMGNNQSQRLTLEPLGGVRYAYLREDLRLNVAVPLIGPVGTKLGGNEEWIEPFVGCRIWWHLNEKFSAGIRTDVGGFGIGSASDLTWNFLAGIDYQLLEKMSLKAGYRILDIDYEGGSGQSKIGIDGQMRGPIVGLTIQF